MILPVRSEWTQSRSARRLAYVAPALTAAIAVQFWVPFGKVIASGDQPPPLVPGRAYWSHWNQFTAGEGSPSFEIITLPYFETMRLVAMVGGSAALFQRIWLTALVVGLACGTVYFALGITGDAIAASVAGLFTFFNAYHLLTGADWIPITTMLVGSLLGGLLVRAGMGGENTPRIATVALVSLGLCVVFVNPPHLVLLALWLLLTFMLIALTGGRAALIRAAKFGVKSFPLVIAVNLWWIAPAALTILSPGFREQFAAEDVDAWSWTHSRASIVNVATLTASWAWEIPAYFPYTSKLDAAPFDALKLFLPLLAATGVLLAADRLKLAATALGVLAVLLIGIGKGLHPPFSGFNQSLYEHVPGFWLFRDPGKVGLLLSTIYAILAGLGTSGLVRSRGVAPGASRVLAALLLGGALAYAHPLFTGEVIPGDRGLLPSARVAVPQSWQEIGAALKSRPSEGKILVLPRADFYQVPTTWGYYGAAFTRLAFDRGVIEPLPGGYFRAPASVGGLVASIEDDLRYRDAAAVPAKLQALGVKYVLVRRDIDRTWPGRAFANPMQLTRALRTMPQTVRLVSNAHLDLYEIPGHEVGEVYAALPVAYDGPPTSIPGALTVARRSALVPAGSGFPPSFPRPHVYRPARTLWRVAAQSANGGLEIRLDDPRRPFPLRSRFVRFPQSTSPLLTVGASTYELGRTSEWRDLGLVPLSRRTVLRTWKRVRSVDILAADGPLVVGDCNHYDARSPADVGLSGRIRRSIRGRVVRLTARDHSACVAFNLRNFEHNRLYEMQLLYRGTGFAAPRVCIWQEGPNRCVYATTLARRSVWTPLKVNFIGEPETTALKIFLYADGVGGLRTVTEYRNIKLRHFLPDETRELHFDELEPATALAAGNQRQSEGRVGAVVPHFRDPPAVGDCHRFDSRTPAEVGISGSVARSGSVNVLRLTAREHSACVAHQIVPFSPEGTYRLVASARSIRGTAPRLCLWQEGPDRCAAIPAFARSSTWQRIDATVTLEPETRGLTVFMYADGQGGERTVTEYRHLRLSPVQPIVRLGRVTEGSRIPAVTYRRASPSEFHARVTNATAPFLLTVTETWSPGWKVHLPGNDAAIRHVMVNGYANGWLISTSGSYDIRIVYEPERLAGVARVIGFAAALIVVLAWSLGHHSVRRRLAAWRGRLRSQSA